MDDEWTDEDVAYVSEKLLEARAAGDVETAQRREKFLRIMVKDAVQRARRYASGCS
jgi:hypothetical protein